MKPLVAACVLIASVALTGSAWAFSRTDALANALYYNSVVTIVAARNVPPAISCPGYVPKLGIGTHSGSVYSFRVGEPFSAETILNHLSAGRGAGNGSAFQAQDPTCVRDRITGIDCSQYVSASWEHTPRFNTNGLSTAFATQLSSSSQVKGADVFNDPGSHMILFADVVAANGTFTSYEANGPAGRCIVRTGLSYTALYDQGYRPWVYNMLKDDPAADLLYVVAEQGGGRVRVVWETLVEKETAGYVVCRGSSPTGEFVAISPVIAGAGSSSSGAAYEFTDAAPSPSERFYRLMEIETSGHEVWLEVTGVVEPAPAPSK